MDYGKPRSGESVDNKGKVTGVSTGVTIITVSINGGLAEAYSIVKVRNGNLEIKANPVGGIVEKGVVVELAVEIQDAVIYYTTDGSYPMENPEFIRETDLCGPSLIGECVGVP